MSKVLRGFTVTEFEEGFNLHVTDESFGSVYPLDSSQGEYLFSIIRSFICSFLSDDDEECE